MTSGNLWENQWQWWNSGPGRCDETSGLLLIPTYVLMQDRPPVVTSQDIKDMKDSENCTHHSEKASLQSNYKNRNRSRQEKHIMTYSEPKPTISIADIFETPPCSHWNAVPTLQSTRLWLHVYFNMHYRSTLSERFSRSVYQSSFLWSTNPEIL